MRSQTLRTSKIERDWTFFMFGTTKPYGVAMAIPMLWEPKIITENNNDSCQENEGEEQPRLWYHG